MQPIAFRQIGQVGDVVEGDALREIEAIGVTQRAAHEIVEREFGHIDEHEARQDLRDAKPDPQQGRDHGIEQASHGAQQEHGGQDPPGSEGLLHGPVMGGNGEPSANQPADDELPLRADVPDIGAKAEAQANGDQHQGACLDGKLLQAPAFQQRIDEIDVESLPRRFAEHRDDDATEHHGNDQGANRGCNVEEDGALRARLKVNAHGRSLPPAWYLP